MVTEECWRTTDSELSNLVYEVATEAGADEDLAWGYDYTAAGRLQQTALLDGFHPEWSPTESTVVNYGSANVLDQYTAVSGRYEDLRTNSIESIPVVDACPAIPELRASGISGTQ